MGGFDPGILQDFLTESGELLDKLEGDLVTLEQDPADPEMLNQVFRALHTIKGSASFLGLARLVSIAHAAESALNAARNRVVTVDRGVMDLLLQAIDILKVQFDEIRAGQDLTAPAPALVEALTRIGEGKRDLPTPTAEPTRQAEATGPSKPVAQRAGEPPSRPLELGSAKEDLLEFLIVDLDDSLRQIAAQISRLGSDESRSDASARVVEMSDGLIRSVDFFELPSMTALARAIQKVAENFPGMEAEQREQLLPRVSAACVLLTDQALGLRGKLVRDWPIRGLVDSIETLLKGGELGDGQKLAAGADAGAALQACGITGNVNGREVAASPVTPTAQAIPAPAATPVASTAQAPTAPEKAGDRPAKAESGSHPDKAAGGEQTIRVDVARLETLMNLVGELVLQKNRIAALSRKISGEEHNATTAEAMSLAAGGLDRVTADIQVAVMRTRMQPLEKLFGKYPRLIRDLARKTGKQIDLAIEGGETEVDKSVIDELGDPLVHLMRNSADHGLEMPADRLAAGKSETGTITLRASHEGSHVKIQVIDNGRGLLREKIGRKAIERGLATESEVAQMSDKEIFRFIMLAGFSTADQVSDLSGRGVGMDVVRANIEKIKGRIDLDSVPGKGTTITITIPLTVAILPAMMVGVANEIYAVPLSNILEIVKPAPDQVSTIGLRPVMRLRDSVLPLVRGSELFGVPQTENLEESFAVVLSMNEKRVGLMVSRLIGQQEIVIKPLDAGAKQAGSAASGATVRDDGGVSLIVDIAELVRRAEGREAAAA